MFPRQCSAFILLILLPAVQIITADFYFFYFIKYYANQLTKSVKAQQVTSTYLQQLLDKLSAPIPA